jgi:acetyl esterase
VTAVAAVREFDLDAGDRVLRVRHYAPFASASGERRPLTVYFHGGGFVIGDLDTHDEPCRVLCREGQTHVLSVAYRLAPEQPFPAAVEDAQAAFAWARGHAAELGADPVRVAVAGDSAGANLAAVVSALAPQDAPPAAQLLIYPTVDVYASRRSHTLFADGFFLTMADRDQFLHHYAGASASVAADPRLSPLNAPALGAVPPAFIAIAGFDPLRDEGEAYAEALHAAGVGTTVLRFPSLPHGFIHVTGVNPAARDAMREIGRQWGRLVEGRLVQSSKFKVQNDEQPIAPEY